MGFDGVMSTNEHDETLSKLQRRIAELEELRGQVEEILKEQKLYDDNDPKNWDILAMLSKSWTEKDKRIAELEKELSDG